MIRLANVKDIDAAYRLMRQLSSHSFTKKQFEDCYLSNINYQIILVWEEEGMVCGLGVLTINYPLHFSDKSAEIVNLIVDAKIRGRGIGKELLAAMEQIAKQNGCVKLEVASGKPREDAHRFYEREGFDNTHYKLTKPLAKGEHDAKNIL